MSNAAHQERLVQVLIGPHVSEKATSLADDGNQVVFKVRTDATKSDVRRAVELLFEVKVERVTVARMPAKAKRFGARQGKRGAWKKAYVRLAPGSNINFVNAE
ncbi:MAG TPA: 50S ribosomal protein L23 [Gammaproteobacteria bacterium]|nr:50S ribosomal protein L23 [Gammaproteobacteria bacterium]